MELNINLRKGKYILNSGDILEVPFKNDLKGYYQFVYKDNEYMGGHLIRAFKGIYQKSEIVNLDTLISLPIKFYTYTRIFEGLKEGVWIIVGNRKIEHNFKPPFFRQTNDAGSNKSYNWFIWQFSPQNRKHIGELSEQYKKLDVSSILPPTAIAEWMETGWHGYIEPQ